LSFNHSQIVEVEMGIDILERPDVDNVRSTESGKVSHIVKAKPDKSAQALVMEARVFGFPVEALCGYTWVPQRDPGRFPICQACKEIFDQARNDNPNLPETPKA
jgi:hypothetical protein